MHARLLTGASLILMGLVGCPADTGNVTTVTVGVFTLDGGGDYVQGPETLVFTVGASCDTWSRTTMNGDATDPNPGHLHYNAADNVSYANDSVTWTEYGPEHSQADIEATCATGTSGATKTVNSTDYTPDKNFFLKIIEAK